MKLFGIIGLYASVGFFYFLGCHRAMVFAFLFRDCVVGTLPAETLVEALKMIVNKQKF